MTNSEQRRDLTVRAYQVRYDTWDDQERSVMATMASETPTMVFDMKRWEPVLEVLRMDGVILPESKQLPLLDSHDRTSVKKVLGSTRDIKVVDGKLDGRNVFSSVEEDAATKVKERHVTDNSIGYAVRSYIDIEPGQTREVEGVDYSAPDNMALRITTAWEPKENSVLAIGADTTAKNREEPQITEAAMPQETNQEAPPVEPPAEELEAREEQAEEKPAVDLEVRKAELSAITPDGYGELFERAVIEGWDVDKYRGELLAAFAKKHEPVGTPDAPEPEKHEQRAEVSDNDFLGAF